MKLILIILVLFEIILTQRNCSRFCNTCDVSNNRCTTCSSIHFRVLTFESNTCSLPRIDILFSSCNTVIEKSPGFFYTCLSNIPSNLTSNCRMINNKSECIACNNRNNSSVNENYYLAEDKTCKNFNNNFVIVDCVNYISPTECNKCRTGRTLLFNKCPIVTEVCNNIVNNICVKCDKPNQFIYQNSCVTKSMIIFLSNLLIFIKLI